MLNNSMASFDPSLKTSPKGSRSPQVANIPRQDSSGTLKTTIFLGRNPTIVQKGPFYLCKDLPGSSSSGISRSLPTKEWHLLIIIIIIKAVYHHRPTVVVVSTTIVGFRVWWCSNCPWSLLAEEDHFARAIYEIKTWKVGNLMREVCIWCFLCCLSVKWGLKKGLWKLKYIENKRKKKRPWEVWTPPKPKSC